MPYNDDNTSILQGPSAKMRKERPVTTNQRISSDHQSQSVTTTRHPPHPLNNRNLNHGQTPAQFTTDERARYVYNPNFERHV